ncbi:hypothetical protein GQ55_2G406200 [Panicum hallii var. hallii]|uniref:Uncharacterized protein n=1 Tax=Panicum hallii var. hallii TaxID=1504633 RepID=A0A2T7EXM8_9POAL|nr:hypothetical protein GQ55_2G406200 [Panicum hallii var. hallii]
MFLAPPAMAYPPARTRVRLSRISQKSRLLNPIPFLLHATLFLPIHPHRRSLPSPARRRPASSATSPTARPSSGCCSRRSPPSSRPPAPEPSRPTTPCSTSPSARESLRRR